MKRTLVIGFLLAACASEQRPTEQGLVLDVAEPGHFAGVFVAGEVGVRFDVARDAREATILIERLDGREVYFGRVPVDGSGTRAELRLLGGEFVASLPNPAGDAFDVKATDTMVAAPDAMVDVTVGDMDSFHAFLAAPEALQLPALSLALGEAGFDGARYPAALSLHMLAKGVAEMADIRVESKLVSDSVEEKTIHPHYNNSYYAKCGPGATCWSWVCGGCGDYVGCGGHDFSCHYCGSHWFSWAGPGECAACALPLEAVLNCSGGHYIYSGYGDCGHQYTGGSSD